MAGIPEIHHDIYFAFLVWDCYSLHISNNRIEAIEKW